MNPTRIAILAAVCLAAGCGDSSGGRPGGDDAGRDAHNDAAAPDAGDASTPDADRTDADRTDAGGDAAAAFAPTRELLGFDCQPQATGASSEYGAHYRFDFQLSAQAKSFEMVPVVGSGVVVPVELGTPSQMVDLQADYRYHNARIIDLNTADELGGLGTYGQVDLDWPILVPYAPQYADMVEPGGAYTLTVAASTDTPCLYVLEGRGGTKLDLNIYLVGSGPSDAAHARSDSDLAAVMQRVDEIYAAAGVQLDQVRYFDVPDTLRARYRVVRSQQEVYELTAYGAPPDDTRDGHLSVDLFLVDDMQFNGADVLGISAGIPGAAGLHGNPREGLVFQTSDLGVDNDHVAHILAHEVGHYIGLRHTTEVVKGTSAEAQVDRLMGATDPIADTPVCDNIQQAGYDCPDADNLMFPAAPLPQMDVDPLLTPGQKAVFQASPLVKE